MFWCIATSSTPPTPVRKKLELLPRSGDSTASAAPLVSPSATTVSKLSPFGAAKYVINLVYVIGAMLIACAASFNVALRPVDVSVREKEVEERLTREREETAAFGRHPMSRETSRQASVREPHPLSRETSRQATARGAQSQSGQSRKVSSSSIGSSPTSTTPTVRPAFSFASAAKRAAESTDQSVKKEQVAFSSTEEIKGDSEDAESTAVEQLAEKITEIAV